MNKTKVRKAKSKGLRISIASAVMVIVLAMAQNGLAIGMSISQVADTQMSIPGGTGTFTAFPTDPAISWGNTVFTGSGTAGQNGVYVLFPPSPCLPSLVCKVADQNTMIPAGSGTFTAYSTDPMISVENTVFLGKGMNQMGIYSRPTDPIQIFRVADLNTMIPMGSGNFMAWPQNVMTPPDPTYSIDNMDIAFLGYGSNGQSGVYALLDGALIRIADTNTLIPGQTETRFSFFPADPIRILSRHVAFIADSDLGEGVYLAHPVDPIVPSDPWIISKIADFTNPIPGVLPCPECQPILFNAYSAVSYDGATVAFIGRNTVDNIAGIYKVDTATPQDPIRVADTGTPVPGGTGNFLDFGNVVIDPGVVVFEGTSSTGKGIYTDLGGTLSKVITEGDMINGKEIMSIRFGPGGYSDGQAVFAATFNDGTQAVDTASLCTSFAFTGFLSPIGGADATGGTFQDPVQAFKLKSTVPIKMTLSCGGRPVVSGTHTIQVTKFTSGVDSDPPIDATPTDAATSGNAFRLTDPSTGEWHFNLDTNAHGMSKGTWQIKVTLSDGSVHTAFIELK